MVTFGAREGLALSLEDDGVVTSENLYRAVIYATIVFFSLPMTTNTFHISPRKGGVRSTSRYLYLLGSVRFWLAMVQ